MLRRFMPRLIKHFMPPRTRPFAVSILLFFSVWTPSFGQSGTRTPNFDFDSALNSAETMTRLHSLLISWNGQLILERYFNGRNANDIANVKSVSKSIMSALVGIAIEQGHINSVEQSIGDFVGDSISGDESTAKQQITIENLLSMQSGLRTTSNRNYGAWVLSPNWIEWALAQPFDDAPGGRMIYSTGNTHLLSAVISTATGMSTLEYARLTLGRPLGFNVSAWPTDPQGVYFGGNDMEFTPRQMLAIGEVYISGGVRNGRRIIPDHWIDATFVRRTESEREPGRYYGYGWWIRDMAGFETPYAWGYGGQFILLIPDLDLVVVTTSSSNPGPDRRQHTGRIYEFAEFDVIAAAAQALGKPVRARSARPPNESVN